MNHDDADPDLAAAIRVVTRVTASAALVLAVGAATLFGCDLYAEMTAWYVPVTRLPWNAAGFASSVAALAVCGCLLGDE